MSRVVPKYQVATEVPLAFTASVGQKTLWAAVPMTTCGPHAPAVKRRATRSKRLPLAAVRLRQIRVTLPAGSVRRAGIVTYAIVLLGSSSLAVSSVSIAVGVTGQAGSVGDVRLV